MAHMYMYMYVGSFMSVINIILKIIAIVIVLKVDCGLWRMWGSIDLLKQIVELLMYICVV